MSETILILLKSMTGKVGIIITLAFLLSKIAIFKRLVTKKNITFVDKIIMSVLFGLFGIIGTYAGVPVNGAIANSRIIGVFVAGWLGGPLVGFLSALIAGSHRWIIDIGGFTAVACAVSTIAEGLLAGYCSRMFKNIRMDWLGALVMGALAELMQMAIILIIARPFTDAIELVKIIWLPMVFVNSIGISIFIAITQSIFSEKERIKAEQAQLTLNIATKTLPYLRMGFNKETSKEAARIIYEMTSLAAVSITDENKILAYVGTGSENIVPGEMDISSITRNVIETGEYKVTKEVKEIENKAKTDLSSGVIVPLKERDKVVGTLKVFRNGKRGITDHDVQLVLGLAKLFSMQIELGMVEYQRKLVAKAELKALQAQINPHFLFNALNTIASFIRTNPDSARNLIFNLCDYIRQNMQISQDEIPLAKEIAHIKSYLAIERARFGNKIDVLFDIDDKLDFKVPPLILQPIVENSIKHGMKGMNDGIKIRISIEAIKDYYNLVVEDNGIGIDKKIIEYIKKGENGQSIGLVNVDKRLKCKYGSNYGLDIVSNREKGTMISIKIPIEKELSRGRIA
ncbi:MAG: sensor histidine kinase [Peptostreptococcaceae bacterium]|nr:sensor histidine kinase [Peptostreptococcaceae bacterium]